MVGRRRASQSEAFLEDDVAASPWRSYPKPYSTPPPTPRSLIPSSGSRRRNGAVQADSMLASRLGNSNATRGAEDATEGIHVAALLWEQHFVAASRVANGHSGPCPLDDHNRSR